MRNNKRKGDIQVNKKTIAILITCISILISRPVYAAKFTSTSPHVNVILNFLSGDKTNSGGKFFIALDEREHNKRGGAILFKGSNVSEQDMLRAYYDPAYLPFVAQAAMRAMSEVDKKNYLYYQRRLAEFQANLDSVVSNGKHCLNIGSTKILDLTGIEGTLIVAAHNNAVRPDKKQLKRWASGDTASLAAMLKQEENKGTVVLVDRWTPPTVLGCLQNYSRKIAMPALETNANYFIMLSKLYRYVASRIGGSGASKKTGKKNTGEK